LPFSHLSSHITSRMMEQSFCRSFPIHTKTREEFITELINDSRGSCASLYSDLRILTHLEKVTPYTG
jgi:hypothetical protein